MTMKKLHMVMVSRNQILIGAPFYYLLSGTDSSDRDYVGSY